MTAYLESRQILPIGRHRNRNPALTETLTETNHDIRFPAFIPACPEQLYPVRRNFYWDIRPKPEYGTAEIRVCDTPLTVAKAADLAAYAQALSAWLLEERPLKPSSDIYLIYSYNRFQAGRYGLHGNFINPFTHTHETIETDILETVERLSPRSHLLESAKALARIAASAEKTENDAAWIRNALTQTKSLSDTVRLQADCWMSH